MTRVPIDPADVHAIERLILRYAELVDDGDFAGVAENAWRWVERTVKNHLVGDVSKHLRS